MNPKTEDYKDFIKSRFTLVNQELALISSNKPFRVIIISFLKYALQTEKLSLSDYNKNLLSEISKSYLDFPNETFTDFTKPEIENLKRERIESFVVRILGVCSEIDAINFETRKEITLENY